MSATLSLAEIQKHNNPEDCWIIIRDVVYNVTEFLNEHPGGAKMILRYAGKDATEEYEPIHPENALDALPAEAKVGTLDKATVTGQPPKDTPTGAKDTEPPAAATPAAASGPKKRPSLDACLSLRDIEIAAEQILTARAFAYFKGGSDDEWTLNWNEESFSRVRFRPRVLIDISTVSMKTTILGQPVSLPFLIAPAAMAKQAHPDGELALARAAAKHGIAQVSCINASYGYETMSKQKDPNQVFYYQVYIHKDRRVTEKDLRRVRELGYKGIFLTVDAPAVGKRERDERVTLVTEDTEGGSYSKAAAGTRGLAKSTSTFFDNKLIWQDLWWIRSIVGPDMPIVVKGIQTAEDAAICARMGAHVYVSNHGGRQLNGAPAAVEILLEIRKHCPWVFDLVEVYADGGFRRGTDIVKAIALGCRGVLLGRPFLFSLAFGQDGAEKTIEILRNEIDTAMRLLGVTSLDQLGPQHVNCGELEKNVSEQYDGPGKPWFKNYFAAKL